MPLEQLRFDEKRAELAWLTARAKLLSAELEFANLSGLRDARKGEQFATYQPDWKIGGRPHLSRAGEAAILAAFESGMRPAEIARLFRISERAAANWHHRWQNRKISA